MLVSWEPLSSILDESANEFWSGMSVFLNSCIGSWSFKLTQDTNNTSSKLGYNLTISVDYQLPTWEQVTSNDCSLLFELALQKVYIVS